MSPPRRMRPPFTLAILLLIWTGCDLPRDPRGTLDAVRGDTLRVGLTEAVPWVTRGPEEEPGGVEPALVRALADELGAEVVWHWGAIHTHMDALRHYELDLVIGGLTEASPWRKEVGMTRAYFTAPVVVAVPAGQPPPDALDGLAVAVAEASPLAHALERRDAVPVRVPDPSAVGDLAVAGPAWEVRQWGFVPSRHVLLRERHVFATPPGENAWIVWLEGALARHAGTVAEQLTRSDPSPP